MNKGKILIVDDEKIVLKAFKEELESVGYLVKTTLSGSEAIKMAKNENFDIVYTDLVMPRVDGVKVCREIKKISPNTEVILISGYPDEIRKKEKDFLEAGGKKQVFGKPLAEDTLALVTRLILEQKGIKR